MVTMYVINWLCGCGCKEEHRVYAWGRDEAKQVVDELQEGGQAAEILIWLYRMPRNKEAILLALNDAAGLDVELPGDRKLVGHVVRKDLLEAETPELCDMH